MNESYEYQRNQILNDPRYPPALRQWALQKLEQVHQKRELFDFSLNPEKPVFDPVVTEATREQAAEAVNRVIKIIVGRIIEDYGNRTYEMAVLGPSFLRPYGGDLDARLILEDTLTDTVFILTKSVDDKVFIKPADNLRWDEFVLKAILWQKRQEGEPPHLIVTAPHLQGKITIIDDQPERRP